MANFNWLSHEQAEQEAAVENQKLFKIEQFKEREFASLTTEEKDILLELLALKTGLIKGNN